MPWFRKKQSPLDRQLDQLDRELKRIDATVRALQRSPSKPPSSVPAPQSQEAQQPAPDQPTASDSSLFPAQHAPNGHTEHDLWTHRASVDASRQAETHRERGLRGWWQSLFGQPSAPSDPRLVSYLSTGSFKTIRPLRYERRVARNRFFFSLCFLIATLALLMVALRNC